MKLHGLVAAAALAAALSSPVQAWAQTPDPEALKAARELAAISLPAGLMDQMIEQSWAGIEQTVRQSAPQASDEKLAALKAEYVKLMAAETAASMEDMPAIFAKHLTAREIRDFIDFYKTDSGKKMLTVMPAAMEDLMQRMNERMMASMMRFQETATRILGAP